MLFILDQSGMEIFENGGSKFMWLDGFLALVLILSCVQGYRRGFAVTFFHALSWILSLVLAFAWSPRVTLYLKENTDFYKLVQDRLGDKLSSEAGSITDNALHAFPEIIRDVVLNFTDAISTSLTGSLSDLLFNLIGFLLVLIVVKLVLFFLGSLFSHKNRGGIIGWLDQMFGLAAGTIKGMILICVLLAIMVPANNLLSGTFLIDQLNQSIISQYLYENNPLFLITRELL